MQVNDLFRKGNTIYRILDMGATNMLIIGCNERTMPRRVVPSFLLGAEQITEEELQKAVNLHFAEYDSLTQSEKQTIHRKYGSIGFILPYVANDHERNRAIALCAEQFGLSKATVRSRLCAYLAFRDIRIFLPESTARERPLTGDEKNFRWALNKYYYTALKLPLKECYRRMLKDRYCDGQGRLLSDAPTFRQFNYYFYKTVQQQNLIISREGKGEFMRNHRVMLGSGIRDFCPSIGYGMLDSTVCDIFLVDERGELAGRPTMTACVDGYTSMCLGYSLGFEKGINSLIALVENIVADKCEHCRKFGIEIEPSVWDCHALPHKLITDKGREYTSDTFSHLAELGIEIVNLPPYRPELKGAVEKFFDMIQSAYKRELASKGVIFEDFQERGGIDYRKKAVLTLEEFEKVVLLCILQYNAKRIIDIPFDKVGIVEPFANALWNHCLPEGKENLITVSHELLRLTLLPRGTGRFKRDGLHVNRLKYKNYAFTERYLKGGECTVAYDPENVSKVWLYENGTYTPFELIEKFFADKSLDEVESMKAQKKRAEQGAEEIALQGKIDLSRDIEQIASVAVTQIGKGRQKHGKGKRS